MTWRNFLGDHKTLKTHAKRVALCTASPGVGLAQDLSSKNRRFLVLGQLFFSMRAAKERTALSPGLAGSREPRKKAYHTKPTQPQPNEDCCNRKPSNNRALPCNASSTIVPLEQELSARPHWPFRPLAREVKHRVATPWRLETS